MGELRRIGRAGHDDDDNDNDDDDEEEEEECGH